MISYSALSNLLPFDEQIRSHLVASGSENLGQLTEIDDGQFPARNPSSFISFPWEDATQDQPARHGQPGQKDDGEKLHDHSNELFTMSPTHSGLQQVQPAQLAIGDSFDSYDDVSSPQSMQQLIYAPPHTIPSVRYAPSMQSDKLIRYLFPSSQAMAVDPSNTRSTDYLKQEEKDLQLQLRKLSDRHGPLHLEPHHESVLAAKCALLLDLSGQKRYAEAETLGKEIISFSQEAFVEAFVHANRDTMLCIEAVGGFYVDHGRFVNAQIMLARARKIATDIFVV
jgi:hypothetical protein